MTREVKANLIFLVALVVLVSPGFFILMKKRLNGPNKPIFMADPVPTVAAYNQPPPVPPALPRVEPATVRAWVTQILQNDAGPSAILMRTSDDPAAGPVMGSHYVTQGLSADQSNGALTVRLLAWDADSLSAPQVDIKGIAAEGSITAEILKVQSIDVPVDVRHHLQDVSFIDPPQTVSLIVCRIKSKSPDAIDRLMIGLPAKPSETLILPKDEPAQ